MCTPTKGEGWFCIFSAMRWQGQVSWNDDLLPNLVVKWESNIEAVSFQMKNEDPEKQEIITLLVHIY